MNILVLNAGSSSLKYKLYDMAGPTELAGGLVERIGEETGRIVHEVPGRSPFEKEDVFAGHHDGLAAVVDLLLDPEEGVIATPGEVQAVGHRVVHGGERFSAPVVIDAEVMGTIRELFPLAPLHNPANLAGIEVATALFPGAVRTAVFDTAFHQSMPPHAYRYAIPTELYEDENIRVYGFHGTSHRFVARVAAEHIMSSLRADPEPPGHADDKPGTRRLASDTHPRTPGANPLNLITAHLGNGASMTAVSGGKSIDNSLGFSPLPGLVMGTRSGDIDPAVVFHLVRERGMAIDEIDRMLNRQSGLVGLCGENDLRDIEARMDAGDGDARLAFDVYVYRIRKYIGAYTAVLGRVDALVFTAGVGENSARVRAAVCEGLEGLGYVIDDTANRGGRTGPITEIQSDKSRIRILVIETDEELEIARQTAELVRAAKKY